MWTTRLSRLMFLELNSMCNTLPSRKGFSNLRILRKYVCYCFPKIASGSSMKILALDQSVWVGILVT